ncbi:lipopolysaccharide heptosyltransferase I [Ramlibacter tataouinensis]|uniref:lipopolysaccharide heptosyltransferase I n=1 Tax=Ramlibacter tataouinensis TaxID=94132 RepID=UPI0022F3AA67|nr:lipopolysaccharide heptosyltransferase I [Ramlibacter tataouinensis]WBY01289.1 lipopolysaccharide heptosyltransferase I [Ramlibacter tataouinensis]
MDILIVKLSSLGDVVHAMPALQDLRAARPDARIDWVVERAFAPLVRRCEGVNRVIELQMRRWRKAPLAPVTRQEWRAFRQELQAHPYDAVLDLQGLTKSALVAHTSRLAAGGRRFALANRTDGSSYEAPTRWVADVAVRVPARSHAVQRSRELCAAALGYELPPVLHYGLRAEPQRDPADARPCIAFVHGTSRDDKCWPQDHWIDLGRRLVGEGFSIGLPHGSEAERQRSEAMAAAIGPHAHVWPRLDLGALADRLAACAGVVGVDSGLSHIAVALALPHVQIYNFDTAWRTGPDVPGVPPGRQRSVYGSPCPSPAAVWDAWRAVSPR